MFLRTVRRYKPLIRMPLSEAAGSPQTLTGDAASIVVTANDATLVPGAVTLAGDAASLSVVANDATIVVGDVTLTGDPAILSVTANDATLSVGGVILAGDAAVIQLTVNDGTISAGAVTLSGDPAVISVVAGDASISGGVSAAVLVEYYASQWTRVDSRARQYAPPKGFASSFSRQHKATPWRIVE